MNVTELKTTIKNCTLPIYIKGATGTGKSAIIANSLDKYKHLSTANYSIDAFIKVLEEAAINDVFLLDNLDFLSHREQLTLADILKAVDKSVKIIATGNNSLMPNLADLFVSYDFAPSKTDVSKFLFNDKNVDVMTALCFHFHPQAFLNLSTRKIASIKSDNIYMFPYISPLYNGKKEAILAIDVKAILALTEPYDEKLGPLTIISAALLNYVHANPDSMADVICFLVSPFWKNEMELARTMISDIMLVDEKSFQSVFINNKDIIEIYKREAGLFSKKG